MLTLLLISMLLFGRLDGPVLIAGVDYLNAVDVMNVTISVAKDMMDSDQSLVIIDVRTVEEFSKGHIRDAVLIPLSILEHRIDELDRLEETLICCASGKRSIAACRILVENGFVHVYNMLGGINGWGDAGYPLTPPVESKRRGSDSYACANCGQKRVIPPTSVNRPDYSVYSSESAEPVEDYLQDIREAISEKGAKWIADETSVSRLPFEERRLLCGTKSDRIPGGADRVSILPNAIPFGTFDWRNVDGVDWMTSVKAQGACGSCWAFGTLGSMEAMINIVENDPTIDMDLSEQFLVSCCDECGDCGGGSPYYAYNFIMDTGVPDEACFPYVASNVPCSPCSDWESRAWFITDWVWVSNDSDSMKWALQTYGPLGVAMYAPDDFLAYKSGIYEPVWSSSEWDETFPFGQANHWVTLVGYDDTEGYWIVKNSWGSDWGEEGYGKVTYGVLEQYDYIMAIILVEGPILREHDLKVSVQAPPYLQPGSDSLLNATVYNNGLHNETDVELFLMINGTVVNNITIPELVNGTSYTIDYLWTPTMEAMYNVTAYAPPVPGENVTANNIATKIVPVRFVIGHVVFEEAHLPAYTIDSNPAADVVGGYSEFANYLALNGYMVSTIDSGTIIDPGVLAPVEALVIVAPMYSYSVSELEAIENWVKTGGDLLLISDWGDFGLPARVIAARFNIDLRGDAICDSDESVGDPSQIYYDGANLLVHPITAGVTRVEMYAGDGITSAPADEIPLIVTDWDGTAYWWSDSSPAVGVSVMSAFDGDTAGSGKLIIMTDSNTWDSAHDTDGDGDINFYDSDNAVLGLNSINWFFPHAHELTVSLEAPPRLQPGETSLLNATVYNVGLNDETNVEIQLLINGTEVTGETLDVLVSGTWYTINYSWTPTMEGIYNITAYAPPVPGENVTANNVATSFVLVQALPPILVVNDNDGSSWFDGTSLPEFESALAAAGYDYAVWNESSMGNPPLDFLVNFELVIWTCGDYYEWAVDPADATTLESYLAQGGNILLEGEDIGYDHDADSFMVNVAHALWDFDDTGAPGLTVTAPTHPVTQGLPTSFTWLVSPPYDDGVIPTNGGFEVIRYTDTPWTAVTVFNATGTGNGSVVYYSFPIYCLAPPERDTLVRNSVSWLGVTIPGDVDGDGDVDATDLSDLITAYGSDPSKPNWNPNCDFNNDGKVDASDLFKLSKNYGKTT